LTLCQTGPPISHMVRHQSTYNRYNAFEGVPLGPDFRATLAAIPRYWNCVRLLASIASGVLVPLPN